MIIYNNKVNYYKSGTETTSPFSFPSAFVHDGTTLKQPLQQQKTKSNKKYKNKISAINKQFLRQLGFKLKAQTK